MAEGERRGLWWAPRVAPRKVRRLYQQDARGIRDEELIDEVGFALHARCLSFLAAEEARVGRALCHVCGAIIPHEGEAGAVLHCATCGWEVPWRDYLRSMQHQQLSGPTLVSLFREYAARFPRAVTPREKMLLIDRLLHGFHWSTVSGPGRPSAVNLIEGKTDDVLALLDELSYGEGSTPGTRDTRERWRRDIEAGRARRREGRPET